MKIDELRAQEEINETLRPVTHCMIPIGISMKNHNTLYNRIARLSVLINMTALLSALIAYVIINLKDGSKEALVNAVANFHIVGYGIMSVSKVLTLFHKQPVYTDLFEKLVELWPASTNNKSENIKRSSLRALKVENYAYILLNFMGLIFYTSTPAIIYLYRKSHGIPSELEFIWHASYPYDKYAPGYYEFTYIFEIYGATSAVFTTLSADMLFTTMASHITLLIRMIQLKIQNLGAKVDLNPSAKFSERKPIDYYDQILSVIKIHQRLISYGNDIEDVFSLVNLIIIVLSSVNICCVLFNIALLEPWNVISSKFFFGSALTQVGIICWNADEIYQASLGVSDAVYESGWYKINSRCRRALLLLMLRSRKPICFTAMKFQNITLNTFRNIFTTSYSYFALLYTMYRD